MIILCSTCSVVPWFLQEKADNSLSSFVISFCHIFSDDELADEYNLKNLPALVYYRAQIPIVFDGDLTKEEGVLEVLSSIYRIQHVICMVETINLTLASPFFFLVADSK
jgi:hypothetical protein